MGTLETLMEMVKTGGPFLVAFAVFCGALYMGYRFIYCPSQKVAREIAQSNATAAKEHAEAARCHKQASVSNEIAAKYNAQISESNARTAAHLERLHETMLQAFLKFSKN